MKPKYQVGQEVWILCGANKHKNIYPNRMTHKDNISNISIFSGHVWSNIGYHLDNSMIGRIEEHIYLTEEESYLCTDEDIFITSKNCWKSELKYLEREEKLKRILNGV